MIDKLYYLSYCFTNAFFYVAIKYLHLTINIGTTEIAFYTNVVSCVLLLYYFAKNFKAVIAGFSKSLRLLTYAVGALFKFWAIQYISNKDAMAIAFLTPFMVTVLSFIVLKEKFRTNDLKKYVWMLISFGGVLVFIGDGFKFALFAYGLMLLHITFKGFVHIFIKQLSNDPYVALFYGVFYNMIVSFFSSTLLPHGSSTGLNFAMCLDWRIILIGTVSVLCQLSIILAYKNTKRISFLQNLDYSRLPLTVLLTYLILGETVQFKEVIGIGIILISLVASDGKVKTLVKWQWRSVKHNVRNRKYKFKRNSKKG